MRARTTASGAAYETCTSLPFGDSLSCTGGDPSPLHFTGKEKDAESALDNFGARYYSSPLGHFSSADEPLADQFEGDPHSWNLYLYVRDDPLNATDPDGRTCTKDKNGNYSGDTCEKDTGTGKAHQVVKVQAPPLQPTYRQLIGRDPTFNHYYGEQFQRDLEAGNVPIQMGELPVGPGEITSLARLAEELLLSRNNVKHILKHLPEFQALDPNLTVKEVVEIGRNVVATGTKVRTSTWVKSVVIGGKEVVVRAAVNANNMLRTVSQCDQHVARQP